MTTGIDMRKLRISDDMMIYNGKSALYSIYEREDSYMVEMMMYDDKTGRKLTRFINVSGLSEAFKMVEEKESTIEDETPQEMTNNHVRKERRRAA